MKHCVWRYIASVVLLAAYLPMVVMSSLHTHHETVHTLDVCHQCAGHIEALHHHQYDCQYCHFLGLDYLGQASGITAKTLPVSVEQTLTASVSPTLPCCGDIMLRAPPEQVD